MRGKTKEQRAKNAAYMRRWRAEHPERTREIDTLSKEKHKDSVRARGAKWHARWRAANRERSNEIVRLWAEKNREKIRAKSKVRYHADVTKSREDARNWQQNKYQFVAAIKLDSGCVDCGFKGHPHALTFDHLPQYEKKFNIGAAIRCTNKQDLLDEISKCEVRCANCHAIKTAERRKGITKERAQLHFEGIVGFEFPISLLQ